MSSALFILPILIGFIYLAIFAGVLLLDLHLGDEIYSAQTRA